MSNCSTSDNLDIVSFVASISTVKEQKIQWKVRLPRLLATCCTDVNPFLLFSILYEQAWVVFYISDVFWNLVKLILERFSMTGS